MRRAAWLGLTALLCLHTCAPAGSGRTTIEAVPDRPDTEISSVLAQDGTLTVDVTSPTGIGSARLDLSGPIPRRMLLRLHLKGLEMLEVAYGQTAVSASLASTPGYGVMESVRKAADLGEREVSPGSQYWMAVAIVPAGDVPASIPLEDGYIEVRLPAHFLSSGERSLTIRWVDFYR